VGDDAGDAEGGDGTGASEDGSSVYIPRIPTGADADSGVPEVLGDAADQEPGPVGADAIAGDDGCQSQGTTPLGSAAVCGVILALLAAARRRART
jgi:hypothetical protein